MTDRERLIELINETGTDIEYYGSECVADYLLANGVIVPPCKVGDTVYYFVGNEICHGIIDTFQIDTKENWFIAYCKTNYDLTGEIKLAFWMFGKTVFLTKEEAEQALKEREQSGC